MWDPSLSSFSVWSLEATSAGLSAGPHTGFHTVLSGSIRQVDEPGREMKDLDPAQKERGEHCYRPVTQNLFWILLS